MLTPINQLRSVHPTSLATRPDKNDNNPVIIGAKAHQGSTPSSVEHTVEIVNRTNQDIFIKDREGYVSRLGRYVGKENSLYLPGKVYIVKRTRTTSGSNTQATTTLESVGYHNSVQVFEIDPTDSRYQTQNPIFLPRFNLLLSFNVDLTDYPYPEPYQQAIEDYVLDIKARLPELTCHLGVYVIDNESTNHQYYLNSWGRVFKVNVIRDTTREDGVYIYQNNIPVTGDNDNWKSRSTQHSIKECLFSHKDKKILAPITLFLDPELALQHGNVATIQEERYNEELRKLKQQEHETKKELLEAQAELERLKTEGLTKKTQHHNDIMAVQVEVEKLKLQTTERKTKADNTKGLLTLVITAFNALTFLFTLFKKAT